MNNIRCGTLQKVLSHGDTGRIGGNALAWGGPNQMIKFSSEAVMNKV